MGFMTLEHSHRVEMRVAREEGLKQGLEQGKETASRRYDSLIQTLLDSGRTEDLKRAANDASFRDLLFEELGI